MWQKNRKLMMNFMAYLLFVILLELLLIGRLQTFRFNYKVGDTAEVSIFTNREVVDEVLTESLRKEAEEQVQTVQSVNDDIFEKVKQKYELLFEEIVHYRKDRTTSLTRKLTHIRATSEYIKEYELTDGEISTLMKVNSDSLLKLKSVLLSIEEAFFQKGISVNNLNDFVKDAQKEWYKREEDSDLKSFGQKLIFSTMEPNLFDDLTKTEELKQQAREAIPPEVMAEGKLIVEKGSTITLRELSLLKSCHLLDEKGFDFLLFMGVFLFSVIIGASILAYLFTVKRELFYSNRLSVILITFVITVVIAYELRSLNVFLLPVSMPILLLVLLSERKVALFVQFTLLVYLQFLLCLPIRWTLVFLVQGLIFYLAAKQRKNRKDVIYTGIVSGVVSVILLFSLDLIFANSILKNFVNYVYCLLSSLLSVVLSMGMVTVFENIFQVLTPFKLLELSDTNKGILKRLMLEAPGTYHHSMMVANLSERAAEEIGANGLLARVLAYYHDIGKLYKPLYFSENQTGILNPHDEMEPLQSTQIIKNHVSEGLVLAKKEKLPEEIICGIREHHGTTLIAYFYHKVKTEMEGVPVSEEEFRYAGPKPETKELAILMLADSCEAAVRSLKSYTPAEITQMVHKVIQTKILDDQLISAPITYSDVSKIEHIFVKFFLTAYHDRIEYPKSEV